MAKLQFYAGLMVVSLITVCAANCPTKFKNQGYTAIPWECVFPTDVDLKATNNFITDVTGVPTGYMINNIVMTNNLLDRFPDFRNFSGTLERLRIGDNPIRFIYPMSLLTDLTKLMLVAVEGSLMTTVPEPHQYPLSLDMYSIFNCPLIKTLPNMCLMNNSQRAQDGSFHMKQNMNFTCGPGMLWTKLAYEYGLMSIYYVANVLIFPSCEEFGGMSVVNVTVGDMLNQEPSVLTKTFVALPDPASFGCPPHVTEVVPHVSRTRCAARCVALRNCAMFATDGGDCVLTEFSDGVVHPRAGFDNYADWYVVV